MAGLIVQAPMAGGPSTPALAAAVSEAGGLGFVAAGYLSIEALRAEIDLVRDLTQRPFGVNLFLPPFAKTPRSSVEAYVERIAPIAERAGVQLGTPRFDDDHFDGKIAAMLDTRPAIVSFTFGCPDPGTIRELQARGIEVWVTVTTATEAGIAGTSGADALVVQGAEAGGHQGSFTDTDDDPLSLLALLPVVAAALGELPTGEVEHRIIATGGLQTAAQIVAVLDAGAGAAQLGTAFMLCPEAGTSAVHRAALATDASTTLTRAFTGRRARGIINEWTRAVGDDLPSAYPDVHHVTSPLRVHGRRIGDRDLINLWAGVGHEHARALPAAELVAQLAAEVAAEYAARG